MQCDNANGFASLAIFGLWMSAASLLAVLSRESEWVSEAANPLNDVATTLLRQRRCKLTSIQV